jgi:hypothetical protein
LKEQIQYSIYQEPFIDSFFLVPIIDSSIIRQSDFDTTARIKQKQQQDPQGTAENLATAGTPATAGKPTTAGDQ